MKQSIKRKKILLACKILLEASQSDEDFKIVEEVFDFLRNSDDTHFPIFANLSGEIVNAYDKRSVIYEK